MRALLVACLLLVATPAVSAAAQQHFFARVSGELTIDPDGSVADVRFDQADWMAPLVRAGYEQQVRAWRFEPIVEDGKPVRALGRMHLKLAAVRDDVADRAAFSIEAVRFLDPVPTDTLASSSDLRRAPVFPREAASAGIGAELRVALRLGPKGVPELMGVDEIDLLGAAPGPTEGRMAARFERATLAAAKHWRFPDYAPGEVLHVPVRYTPPGWRSDKGGWIPVYPVAREVPAWVLADAADGQPVELADNGEAVSQRLRLLTPLSPEG